MKKETTSCLLKKEVTRKELYHRFAKVQDYIHNNLENELNIKLLAGLACVSEYHFIRIFNQFYGTTPYRYILKMRIKKATALVVKGNRTYAEISSACGFENKQSFRKCFKRLTGKSISKYL